MVSDLLHAGSGESGSSVRLTLPDPDGEGGPDSQIVIVNNSTSPQYIIIPGLGQFDLSKQEHQQYPDTCGEVTGWVSDALHLIAG